MHSGIRYSSTKRSKPLMMTTSFTLWATSRLMEDCTNWMVWRTVPWILAHVQAATNGFRQQNPSYKNELTSKNLFIFLQLQQNLTKMSRTTSFCINLNINILTKNLYRYNEGEIHFNLMAIVSDRKMIYEKQKLNCVDEAELSRLQIMIEEEMRKSKRYQIENIRRKHNYLPLIVELLKVLAKEGKLVPLYQKAKERAIAKESKTIKSWIQFCWILHILFYWRMFFLHNM